MKKKLYFGSNFKMYKNIHATEEYLQAITAATKDIDREKVQFFFIPSYTSLESAGKSSVRDRSSAVSVRFICDFPPSFRPRGNQVEFLREAAGVSHPAFKHGHRHLRGNKH